MVGLSVVLEAHKSGTTTTTTAATKSRKKTVIPLVINKAAMIKPPPNYHRHHPPPPLTFAPSTSCRTFHLLPPLAAADSFLDACFLCQQKLLPGKDIYMYKGDTAFCSEECRWKQMITDEEENTNGSLGRRKERANNIYSFAAMKPISTTPTSSTTRPRHHQNHRRATRTPAAGRSAR